MRLCTITSGPSKTNDASPIGSGTTRLPHTTSDNGFTRPSRFELKFAKPHEHAASNRHTRPAAVTSPPVWAATRQNPTPAMSAPATWTGAMRSFNTAAASANVTKTWNCNTSDANPAGIPSFMPVNKNANCNANIVSP